MYILDWQREPTQPLHQTPAAAPAPTSRQHSSNSPTISRGQSQASNPAQTESNEEPPGERRQKMSASVEAFVKTLPTMKSIRELREDLKISQIRSSRERAVSTMQALTQSDSICSCLYGLKVPLYRFILESPKRLPKLLKDRYYFEAKQFEVAVNAYSKFPLQIKTADAKLTHELNKHQETLEPTLSRIEALIVARDLNYTAFTQEAARVSIIMSTMHFEHFLGLTHSMLTEAGPCAKELNQSNKARELGLRVRRVIIASGDHWFKHIQPTLSTETQTEINRTFRLITGSALRQVPTTLLQLEGYNSNNYPEVPKLPKTKRV